MVLLLGVGVDGYRSVGQMTGAGREEVRIDNEE